MYVPEKLKLNKFIEVRIPKASDYFSIVRQAVQIPENMYSGEVPAPSSQRKMDTISNMEDYEAYLRYTESQRAEDLSKGV